MMRAVIIGTPKLAQRATSRSLSIAANRRSIHVHSASCSSSSSVAPSPSSSSSSSPSSSPFSVSSGAVSMYAAVARSAAGPLSIDRVLLRAPRSDEVRVRLVATGLCHTDVAVLERGLCAFPMVLGHEGAGIVDAIGSGVSDIVVGDHVLLSYASCGGCPHCLIGKPMYCYEHGSENFGGTDTKDGTTRHRELPSSSSSSASDACTESGAQIYGSFFRQSSFAEYALATSNNIVVIRDRSLSLALLAPLGCGIQTGAGAVLNSLAPPAGANIAIFGCGAVGLAAIMAAQLARCNKVVAIDRNQHRLDLAKQMGATDVIKVTGKETSAEVVELIRSVSTISSVNFGYSLDTSGSPTVLRSAFDLLSPLGVCGLIGGAAPGTNVQIDMLNLLPGKSLRGIIQGDAVAKVFLPQLIEHYRKGQFPFEKMITEYSGLESINQAIADVKDGNGKVIKPVIKISQQ